AHERDGHGLPVAYLEPLDEERTRETAGTGYRQDQPRGISLFVVVAVAVSYRSGRQQKNPEREDGPH
ncbi:MAG TPA: hypothetical protein VFE76_17535, partial [Myxococcales bacterium]|nr:hypothetical protein [Myxococcales bacterium]